VKKTRWYALILCLIFLVGCSKKEAEEPVEEVTAEDVGDGGMAENAPSLNY